jgi:ferritin heavy chain
MKAVAVLCVALFVALSAEKGMTTKTDKFDCTQTNAVFPGKWDTDKKGEAKELMNNDCTEAVRIQIQEEMNAAMKYMSMGAYFSRASVNRPGFAKLFFDAASEERGHSIKLISYLLNRGELTLDISKLLDPAKQVETKKFEWTSTGPTDEGAGVKALKDALDLESKVTEKIRYVIKVCEAPDQVATFKPDLRNDFKLPTGINNMPGFNDYELVDYLTGEFLTEQYKGERELAGKISTLGKLIKQHKELGEWMFDKTLL